MFEETMLMISAIALPFLIFMLAFAWAERSTRDRNATEHRPAE